MTPDRFKQSAAYITKRNVTKNIAVVLARFDVTSGHFTLEYFTKGDPTEDDIEWCEIDCTELLAEFPEIRTAETKCEKLVDTGAYSDGDVVYKFVEPLSNNK
jgi:hypothetical protein